MKAALLCALYGQAGALTALPTIKTLQDRLLKTEHGAALSAEDALRSQGLGSPHRAAKLRSFGSTEEPRLTLYRDSAAWCPYCQKLWMLLEEKRVPYKVELINMRSYGNKPASFTSRVSGGILPAIELDGMMYTDSLQIMFMVEDVFGASEGHRLTLPEPGTPEFGRSQQLLRAERGMFGAWCDYVFRGGWGARGTLERTMDALDAALQEQSGPWLSDFTDGPSIVDLQYLSHVERICASVAYWKGDDFRGSQRWPAVDRWFEAFEQRPSYAASRSDWYSHVNDIPPQYGAGVFSNSDVQKKNAKSIDLVDCRLPLAPLATSTLPADVLQPGWAHLDAQAPAEAAWQLLKNFDKASAFAARAVGQPGGWALGRPDRARLSDPLAKPAEGEALEDARLALTLAASILVDGFDAEPHAAAAADLFADLSPPRRAAAAKCCDYMRDRVGVPRDMSYPAARQLRATLAWTIEALER
ncbi:hypothetical protein M885DRAFT_317115 [Pelagophyceae sp. CCMP2097]|nr:hypothetical protein M885DRAFT_317115 [Pelagophyceae sp. CCMP2097]